MSNHPPRRLNTLLPDLGLQLLPFHIDISNFFLSSPPCLPIYMPAYLPIILSVSSAYIPTSLPRIIFRRGHTLI